MRGCLVHTLYSLLRFLPLVSHGVLRSGFENGRFFFHVNGRMSVHLSPPPQRINPYWSLVSQLTANSRIELLQQRVPSRESDCSSDLWSPPIVTCVILREKECVPQLNGRSNVQRAVFTFLILPSVAILLRASMDLIELFGWLKKIQVDLF